MTCITDLSEWWQNFILLLKRQSAAPLYLRINAGLLATNSARKKDSIFQLHASSLSQRGLHKSLEKKNTIPHHFNKPGFIQQHSGQWRPAGCVIHRKVWKAHWDAQTDVAKQIKCQRFSKFSLRFLKLVFVNHRWQYNNKKTNLPEQTWVDISALYRQLFRFHFQMNAFFQVLLFWSPHMKLIHF